VTIELASLPDIAGAIAVEVPPWDLMPSVARVNAIDRALRLRLADSLTYLAAVACLEPSQHATLESIQRNLHAARVSPWVFCLYSKLVAELAKSPRRDVSDTFGEIAKASSLPTETGIVSFCDPAVPSPWWDHFRLLFDTDRQRPFRPRVPSVESFVQCQETVEAGLTALKRADRVFHDEVRNLIPMIVLAAPGSADPGDRFNGASTFFLWGASLLNAELSRSSIAMVELLVHESSHVLLFGASADGALTENSGSERYDSPLRPDKRPIDGIFHACFVSTRVHLAMKRLVCSGALSDEEHRIALERAGTNGEAARSGIDELDRHARLTELGEQVLATLRVYWDGVPPH
jgi:hypothetical protein